MDKLNIKNFVKCYKKQANASLREKYLNDNVHLITEYIPYMMKISYVKNIVDATSFKIIDGKPTNEYEINTPMQFLLYVMTLVDKYTNIGIVYGDDDYTIADQYDIMKESEVLNYIMAMIPQSEIAEFKAILNSQVQDAYQNHGTSIEKFLSAIDNVVSSLKENKEFIDMFNKLVG